MFKNKKIAFVTSGYMDSNFSSGGIKLNYILLNGLKNLNYSVDLFCDKIITYENKIFANIYSLLEFENLKQNYDYILTDKGFIPSDITYIHDHSYIFRTKYMSNEVKHFFYKIFNRKKHNKRLNEYLKIKNNLSATKKVVVSSQILKLDVIENFGISSENIVIIPPPIENHKTLSKRKNNVFTFGISAVGFERKGGYILLKAIKELKKTHKNFKIIFIYPSKNLFVNLLKKIYGIDKYCEFIEIQKDINNFYSSIDCLIMPSIIEPFGMVATEALSNGCPVITATHCGAADCIINGKNGYLYDASKNPSKELAKTMQIVLNLGIEGMVSIRDFCIDSAKQFNEEIFVQEYLEIFDILDSKK